MPIIQRIKQLNLPLGEYVVIGSGLLDALGLRTAGDIDIAVTPKLFASLQSTGEWKEAEQYNKAFLLKDGVEISSQLEWGDFPTTVTEAINSSIVVDGVPFLNMEELKKFKRAFGRQKDYDDIALLDAYLLSNPANATI